MENKKQINNLNKEKKTFNLTAFNENKTAYSCCYSGITFYQPARRSR